MYEFLIINRISFPRDVMFLYCDAWNNSSTSADFSGVIRNSNPFFPVCNAFTIVNGHKYRQHEHKNSSTLFQYGLESMRSEAVLLWI